MRNRSEPKSCLVFKYVYDTTRESKRNFVKRILVIFLNIRGKTNPKYDEISEIDVIFLKT